MKFDVLFHCNEWKEHSSFKLIGVVEENHLREAIEKIKSECNYTDQDIDKYIYIEEVRLNDLDI